MADALDRLAEHAGLEAGFTDALGGRHDLRPATKQALLRAMGFRVETPEQVVASLSDFGAAPWRRPLEPVLVQRRQRKRPPSIPITLPANRLDALLRWTFVPEGGAPREGAVRFADLPLARRHALDGAGFEQRLFELPVRPPLGYHRFGLGGGAGGTTAADTVLILVPRSCYGPPGLRRDGKTWGVAVQLYGLRSARNWGMGDFTDLAHLVEITARLGGGAVGLNPLHALFPGNPAHAGPYSPSDRRFLNSLYLDVEAIPDLAECESAQGLLSRRDFRAVLAALRATASVDYVAVAAAKRPVLELLYQSFRERHLGRRESARGAAFRRFQRAGGRDLERLAIFEALAEHLGGNAWRGWPAPFRDPASAPVAAFARAHQERVEFFQYLQWQADAQLGQAAARGKALGMSLGLYHDLALGADGSGAEAWAQQDFLVEGVSLGAPPDAWNLKGQNWGLPPFNPIVLRERAYAPFAAILRANMRHGGALRIDHVMALMRLYWIPAGAPADQGGYVRQSIEDLLGVLALESWRQRCLVVGEDLGTVPEGFRRRLEQAGILSYRLLYFEKDARGEFLPPKDYPRLATVAVSTHDLTPLPGFWAGRDLAVRAELDLYPDPAPEAAEEARRERAAERQRLLAALAREGLLDPAEAGAEPPFSPALAEAVYRYLAGTPALLLMAHLEDILGEEEQINLPGTTDEHPNWRRKMRLTIEELERDPRVLALAATLRALRPPPTGRR